MFVCGFEGISSYLHEWLSGGVSPCQGEGRGFESRLVLFLLPEIDAACMVSGFFKRKAPVPELIPDRRLS